MGVKVLDMVGDHTAPTAAVASRCGRDGTRIESVNVRILRPFLGTCILGQVITIFPKILKSKLPRISRGICEGFGKE
jgi:hypothetical protein